MKFDEFGCTFLRNPKPDSLLKITQFRPTGELPRMGTTSLMYRVIWFTTRTAYTIYSFLYAAFDLLLLCPSDETF